MFQMEGSSFKVTNSFIIAVAFNALDAKDYLVNTLRQLIISASK